LAERLDAERRRRVILETAMEIIDREGHQGLTMRALARRFGMSAPGLMHYFPSIQSLVVGVVQYRDERDIARLEADQYRPQDVRELLRAIVANIVERPKAAELFAIVEAEAIDPQHAGHQFFRDRTTALLDYVEPMFAQEYAEPRQLAAVLFATMDGLQLNWLRDPSAFDLAQAWDQVADAVLAAAPRA
jgi:AcrR family transcriptional regulator